MGFMVRASADEARPINIPEGDLSVALTTLARQNKVEIIYVSEQLQGVHTAGTSGVLTPELAVYRLLEGTNFTAVVDASGAILVTPKPATTAAANSAKGPKPTPDTIRVAQTTPVPASTGNELEEVIVTAERRTVDIQSVPASVTVRTGEELAAQGRYTTRQILEDIPDIVAVDNNSRNNGSADVQGNNITIRGITPGNSAAGGVSGISAAPGTAVYVDGVFEGIGSGYDIDRVEVLRGPQGTLYGRSATTGVVAFHTRNPSMDGFAGNASAEFANYDLQHYSGAVNMPLTAGLALRVSGDYYDQGEGYYNQATRGAGTRTNGRAKLLWQPSDTFSLLAGVAYEKRESFGGGKSYTASLPTFALITTTAPLVPGLKEQRQYWAEANLHVGRVTVTYLPAFRTWEQDDTSLATNVLQSGQNRQTTQKTPKDNFNTHELRVASKDDATVQWQAGAFYYRNTLNNNVVAKYVNPTTGVAGATTTDSNDLKDTQNLGVFAETTIPLNDSMRMTLGARYDDTRVLVSETLFDNIYMNCGTAIQASVPLPPGATCTGPGTATVAPPPAVTINGIELKFHNFNYKARLEYDLTQKNMLYGMISTGFRPGDAGVSNRAANILAAEKLTSIEVGSKNRFLDDSLQLNVGVFYYNYQGFQTFYNPDTPNPADYANPGSFINLTVPARNLGGELELLYRFTAHDRIGLNGNYVESRWYDKPAGFAAAQTETKRAMTPYTITANYAHVFNLPGGSTLSARVDGRYEAAHLSTNLHVDYLRVGQDRYVHLDARTVGNLSAAWASNGGRYSLSAYVRNFADKQYTSYGVAADLTRLSVTYSDPRTYGAQASVRF